MNFMIKTVDNKSVDGVNRRTSDEPLELDFEVVVSLYELEEMLEQRLDNKPQGEKSEKQWKRDVNDLVDEINTIVGFNKWSKV